MNTRASPEDALDPVTTESIQIKLQTEWNPEEKTWLLQACGLPDNLESEDPIAGSFYP